MELAERLIRLKSWQRFTEIPLRIASVIFPICLALWILLVIFTGGSCDILSDRASQGEFDAWYFGLSGTSLSFAGFILKVVLGVVALCAVGLIADILISPVYKKALRAAVKSIGDTELMLPIERLPAALSILISRIRKPNGDYDQDIIGVLTDLGNQNSALRAVTSEALNKQGINMH